MSLLARIFTWWNGSTIGTNLFTSRFGEKVGEDEAGNVFYQNAGGEKRWVIYNGEVEASRVSPDWHGWLHHTYDQPPTEAPLIRKSWEKAHKANQTGLPTAYVPPGSIRTAETRPKVAGDYEAWSP
ncbi:MAG: NADH:ubiquinone oxidoreductase subunit NDUFA12 [Pseudomonadota bacterium]